MKVCVGVSTTFWWALQSKPGLTTGWDRFTLGPVMSAADRKAGYVNRIFLYDRASSTFKLMKRGRSGRLEAHSFERYVQDLLNPLRGFRSVDSMMVLREHCQ